MSKKRPTFGLSSGVRNQRSDATAEQLRILREQAANSKSGAPLAEGKDEKHRAASAGRGAVLLISQ